MDGIKALFDDFVQGHSNVWRPAELSATALVAERQAVYHLPRKPNMKRAAAQMAIEKGSEAVAARMNDLLLAIAENRDSDAFRSLFDHFAPRIRGFINRQGSDPEMAEEVVQETFVNIWRKARLFDPEKASASTWIFAIARNTRIDLFRKANRPAPDLDDPALVADPEPSAHQLVVRELESVRLKKVLSLLPAEQQEVLHLSFFEEKAHTKVAEELGIPLGTVKSRIRLALGRMRLELGESR